MEAKQFVFMLAAVILGAIVLFTVGMEVGRRVDTSLSAENFGLTEAASELKEATAAAGDGASATARADYSFFDDLARPATKPEYKRLSRAKGNANNPPEIREKLRKQRLRKERREMRRLKRESARANGPPRIKRLTRKPSANDPTDGAVANSTEKPAVTGLLAAPPTAIPRVITREAAPASNNRGRAYTVQIGVYRSEAAANEAMAKLRSQGHAPKVTRSDVPGKGPIYRVRLGRFSTIDDADAFRTRVDHSALVTPL